jgi:hypothetical protein
MADFTLAYINRFAGVVCVAYITRSICKCLCVRMIQKQFLLIRVLVYVLRVIQYLIRLNRIDCIREFHT